MQQGPAAPRKALLRGWLKLLKTCHTEAPPTVSRKNLSKRLDAVVKQLDDTAVLLKNTRNIVIFAIFSWIAALDYVPPRNDGFFL
ncbi:hypothetical protein [Rickettsia endosymbiont of Orchestes rusci]|uniref:hypothetical protein n=1 Tax=Rickettsia endosymbiont of Orchestes rusci TaxID=3066250 RepID=UPI00313A7861